MAPTDAIVNPPPGHTFATNWSQPFGIKRDSDVWVFEMKVVSGMLVEAAKHHLGYDNLTKTVIAEAFKYVYKDWLKTRPDYKTVPLSYANIHKQTSEGRRGSRAITSSWVWINNLDTDDQAVIAARDQLRQPLIDTIKAAIEHVRAHPGEVTRDWTLADVDDDGTQQQEQEQEEEEEEEEEGTGPSTSHDIDEGRAPYGKASNIHRAREQ
ncbi:hypothetical protein EJ03DRAFT_338838 [Teratosphaeria nubilosa]|uniref:Uncharacterized protein n=1 Tax=Teratosphaeria nubilosa TaxID=161662 RepID=A0A6G1KYN4_9PEZI|nr:hypothetical protein EJ03DRAFT_338838 [Teratosphaeria nubilosa]